MEGDFERASFYTSSSGSGWPVEKTGLALLNPIGGTPPARTAIARVNDTLRKVFAH